MVFVFNLCVFHFWVYLVDSEDTVVDEKENKSAVKRLRPKKNIRTESPTWGQLISQFSQVGFLIYKIQSRSVLWWVSVMQDHIFTGFFQVYKNVLLVSWLDVFVVMPLMCLEKHIESKRLVVFHDLSLNECEVINMKYTIFQAVFLWT